MPRHAPKTTPSLTVSRRRRAYTDEELRMFLDNKNYKTLKSYYIIYKFNFKLFLRLLKARIINLFNP